MPPFDDIVSGMRRIVPGAHYFALTVTSPEGGGVIWSAYTHWVGWADPEEKHELRAASLVRPDALARTWESAGQSHVVVNGLDELVVFLQIGGNAIVEQATAEKYLADVIAPSATVRSGPYGFRSVDGIPNAEFNRAPTPKQRMRILKRDGYRCRLCGRRSADHVDVELHVHHIRPWARGGLTEDTNLITLCHTCHRGLDPHEDFALFSLLEPPTPDERRAKRTREFDADVQRYREGARQVWSTPPS